MKSCIFSVLNVSWMMLNDLTSQHIPVDMGVDFSGRNRLVSQHTLDGAEVGIADFNSVMLVIIGACANGAVTLIVLIIVVLLAWNYLKLLFEAAERYILLGVLVYTAPVAFSMGGSQSTANIFKAWCRMLGGQVFLLLMNAWCLRLFTSMVGTFIANPLSL